MLNLQINTKLQYRYLQHQLQSTLVITRSIISLITRSYHVSYRLCLQCKLRTRFRALTLNSFITPFKNISPEDRVITVVGCIYLHPIDSRQVKNPLENHAAARGRLIYPIKKRQTVISAQRHYYEMTHCRLKMK